MKSNKKRFIVVLAILTMAILLSCAFVACDKVDTGDRGTNGTNGQDGIDGKSAYQIWLDNGNTGTEADFLTWLKGKDGANGQDGKDGANGKDGTGIQSATINNNGELIVTLDDGTIINAGQVVAPEKRLDENNQITFKTFEKTDKTIYGKVSNDTETFYFTDEIELKGGASYSVYTDFDCSNELISKVVKLNVGDNTFYIMEKCGNDSKFYTVTIRRRDIYTVTFAVNDGTPLENSTIKIEEDGLVPKASVPSSPRDGYDLVWDNDFKSPITENTVITATLTAIYSVSENTITGLTDYGKSLTVLNIPNVIDGKSVTSIDDYAFSGCKGLTSVTIGNSVTYIGFSAFRDCTSLTTVTIPDNVTNIGEHAFGGTVWYNNQLNGLVYAGKVAYQYKGEMPSNTSIVIKEGTLGIGDYAFRNCSGLTSVVIPDSVTSIGGGAFAGCKGLTSITIPNSVTSIGYSAFSGCTGLTSITIPDSVTSIGESAFNGCSGLTNITIPDSVTSIGRYAFMNCTGLTNITIPDSVTSIGDRAFYDTTWYNNQPDGLVYAGKVAYKYKGTMPSNTSIVLKEGTLGIADFAFQGCSGLTSITIPDSVTSVGYAAFSGCTGLIKIIGPSDAVSAVAKQCDSKAIAEIVITSGTSISDCAFRDCKSLTTVTIPDSVTSIDGSAFSGCTGLTSITIPNGVTSICNYAFFGCTGLTTINFNGTITQWNAISKGTDWKYKVPSTCKVVCTDGEIPISEA